MAKFGLFKKAPSDTVLPAPEHLEFVDDGAAAVLLSTPTRARALLWACFLFFMSAIIWAAWAELDEVTVGQGKVIPSRQLQVIQNLEGGSSRRSSLRKGTSSRKGSHCYASMIPVSVPTFGSASRSW